MRIFLIEPKRCQEHAGENLQTQSEQKPRVIRWTTQKGLATVIVFLAAATLIEFLVILYAMRLGVEDTSVLRWSFNFPGTGWPVTIGISLAFLLVPICVIITLAFSWMYLTKKASLKRQEIRRGKVETFPRKKVEKRGLVSRISRAAKNYSKRIKSRLPKTKEIHISQRIRFARPTIRSAFIVLLTFVAFTLLFSLFAYPQAIFQFVTNAYRTDPSLRHFVISVDNWAKGAAQALGPIGWLSTAINNALLAAAPGVRNAGVGLGGLISPIATLADIDKFLLFQNAAVWISVLLVVVYGEQTGKSYRYKK